MFTLTEKTFRATAIGAAAAAMLAGALVGSAQASTAGTLPACEPGQLDVKTISRNEAMLHREITYQLTNTSEQECLVYGAPQAVEQTNNAPTTTTVGSTYFTKNGESLVIPLKQGWSAEGKIGWTLPDAVPDSLASNRSGTSSENGYDLFIVLPDVGHLKVGYHDITGALDGHYTVTNLTDGPK